MKKVMEAQQLIDTAIEPGMDNIINFVSVKYVYIVFWGIQVNKGNILLSYNVSTMSNGTYTDICMKVFWKLFSYYSKYIILNAT